MALYTRTPWLSVNSGQTWPGPEHGTPDVNSGTVPGIPGQLATLMPPPPVAPGPAPGKGNWANHNKITIMIVFCFRRAWNSE